MPTIEPSAETFLQAVTDFIFVEDSPERADVILVPGSNSPENALHAARLYHDGYAPLILPSGRFSKAAGQFAGVAPAWQETYPGPYETEWDFLRTVLLLEGVLPEAILREDHATYTWENAKLSRKVLEACHRLPQKAILCCKPWHARRARMYYAAALPETRLLVCPAPVPGMGREDWFLTEKGRNTVLGEVSRCGDQLRDVLTQQLTGELHPEYWVPEV